MAISFQAIDCRWAIKHKRAVSKWLKECAANENKELGDIAIVLCSDDYILNANREFLQHDYFTDIITFDYSEDKTISGDLLISIDTVRSNAQEYGVSVNEELMRVMVHGVLHLCGYPDKSEQEAKTMRQKEDFYLALLTVPRETI